MIFKEYFAYMWLEDMEHFTYSKCKVGSLSWFADYGMRICEGVETSNCSYLVDPTSIPHI
jgi:hypothetical protein